MCEVLFPREFACLRYLFCRSLEGHCVFLVTGVNMKLARAVLTIYMARSDKPYPLRILDKFLVTSLKFNMF